MRYELPEQVAWVIDRLLSRGHDAYAVGGCVRDFLLSRRPKDWDVCTSAPPDQVKRAFLGARVLETGIRHGTVTVIRDGLPVEVTTYRVDGAYTDHRRPDAVRFTESLTEDLARRDFTINAMAYRPDTGVIDPFSGREDLARGVIRCVGNPDERFEEDALRLLRALRFSSRFGFAIEEATARAMLSHREQLRFVAQERVLAELLQIHFSRVDAAFLPVLRVSLPELAALPAQDDPDDPALHMAALLRGLNAGEILLRLKASRALMERAALLAAEPDLPRNMGDREVRRLLRRMGPEAALQLCRLSRSEGAARAVNRVLSQGDAYEIRHLVIGGRELTRLGFAGEAVGNALNALLDRVVNGTLANEREVLLKAAEEMARKGV